MTDPRYTVLSMHEFKAKMCEYMRRLHAGEGEYIVKRYGRPVAVILSAFIMEENNKAAAAERELKRYMAAQRRHEIQRRRIKARLLSWPGRKAYDAYLHDLADPAKLPSHLKGIFDKY